MIEKIKNLLINISIIYIIVIVIMALNSYANFTEEVEISSSEEVEESIKDVKKKIETVKSNSCRNYLNDFINYIIDNNYDGVINLKDLYQKLDNDKYIYDYYQDGQKACNNFTYENAKKHELDILFISAGIQNDLLFKDYLYQYEISFKDYLVRDITRVELNNINNQIKVRFMLKAINNIILMEEEGYNEE